MACFKLPKATCAKIKKLFASFWWKNQSTSKGIHWKKWQSLCLPKANGGLGFKDPEGFNIALLGKQLWRLLNNPSSLISRLLKGKYFPNSTPLTAKLGSRPSLAWRSILSSQSLIKLGARKDVGNGDNIHLWTDPWLSTAPPRAPFKSEGCADFDIQIQHLLHPNSDEWNIQALHNFILPSDIPQVCKIRPSSIPTSAGYTWTLSKNGAYTVKSGYWNRQHSLSKDSIPSQVSSNLTLQPFFDAVWQLKTEPKIKNFLWKAISNILAVNSNLSARHITSQTHCNSCNADKETVNHALFTCPLARLVWANSSCGFLFAPFPEPSLYSNLAKLLFHTPCKSLSISELAEYHNRLRIWPWIIWRLWKARNNQNFDCKWSDLSLLNSQVLMDADIWFTASASSTPTLTQSSVRPQKVLIWKPPPLGHLKCNIDATWSSKGQNSGIGWVLRDNLGKVKWTGARSIPHLSSSLMAEASAVLWAYKCVHNLGYSNVIFETDCKSLLQAYKHPVEWPILSLFVQELKSWSLSSFSLAFCFRPANSVADAIANVASLFPLYYGTLETVLPTWLIPKVESDVHKLGSG